MKTIGVIGAGTMGTGIAQLAAANGCRVRLADVSREMLGRGMASIQGSLEKAVAKGKLSAHDCDAAVARIVPTVSIGELGDVDVAIEAIVEKLDAKQQLFATLEQSTPKRATLATNTSSLSVSRIAEPLADPSRLIGMHFFNPAPLMPLVEIIAGAKSAPQHLDAAAQLVRNWGKTAVRVKDAPGFIVNRVARGYYLEALRMLGEGIAGVDTIDTTLRELGGFRMGPFELMDLVGLDVNYAVSTSVWEQFGKPARLAPHDIQRQLVDKGHLGRKTGRGFYDYSTDPPAVAVRPPAGPLAVPASASEAAIAFTTSAVQRDGNSVQRYVLARILATVMNEAALALDEGVATADDIDIAMQKGTNYPQGPLAWAQRVGHDKLLRMLEALSSAAPDSRFQPASSLRSP